MNFENWDYPQPGFFSATNRDASGWLRVKGALLKKGGSTRGSVTDGSGVQTATTSHMRASLIKMAGMNGIIGRRWSERWFFLDLEAAELRYYHDEDCERMAGVLRFKAESTLWVVEGDKAQGGEFSFELRGTEDEAGNLRTAPFEARAKTKGEYDEWMRSIHYCLDGLRDVVRQSDSSAEARHSDLAPPPPPPENEDLMEESDDAASKRRGGGDACSPQYSRGDGASYKVAEEEEEEEAAVASGAVDDDEASKKPSDAIPNSEFTQADLASMEYYYQNHDGDLAGPVDLTGLRLAWARFHVDELSYIYTNRRDEWVAIEQLPVLYRLLKPPDPPKARTPQATQRPKSVKPTKAPKFFRL